MLDYKLKLRSSPDTKEEFQKEIVKEVRLHTSKNIQWRDAWDNSEPTVTICFFTPPGEGFTLWYLAGVAHGYYTPDGDGVSKGKARVFIDTNILDDWKD